MNFLQFYICMYVSMISVLTVHIQILGEGAYSTPG